MHQSLNFVFVFVPASKMCCNVYCQHQLKSFVSCLLFYFSLFLVLLIYNSKGPLPTCLLPLLLRGLPSLAKCGHFQLHYRFKFPTYVHALCVWRLNYCDHLTKFSCLLLSFSSSHISIGPGYSVHTSTNILCNFKHSSLDIMLPTYM